MSRKANVVIVLVDLNRYVSRSSISMMGLRSSLIIQQYAMPSLRGVSKGRVIYPESLNGIPR